MPRAKHEETGMPELVGISRAGVVKGVHEVDATLRVLHVTLNDGGFAKVHIGPDDQFTAGQHVTLKVEVE